MQFYRTGAGFVPSEVTEDVVSLPIGNHEIPLADRKAHLAVRQDGSARYILLCDTEEHEEPLFNSLLLTLTSGTLLAPMVLLAGHVLAGRLAARIDSLSAFIPSFQAAP